MARVPRLLARLRRRRPPPWGPVASREEARAYVQQRLALFTKLMFWTFWLMVVSVLGLYQIYPDLRPARAYIVHEFAIAGLILAAVIWYVGLYRLRPSIENLYRLDVFYALVIGTGWGLSAYFASDLRAASYSAFIWHTFMVFTRAIILPSTGRRTGVVTSASFVPLLIAGVALAIYMPERLELPPAAFLIFMSMFVIVAVILATTGSRVIYGLRRQVSEARQLGQYTLDEKIGEGGMGAVYRARHAMLRRPTAIKLLPPERIGAGSLRRFEREVQQMSRLTHPNTVAVFDYGRSPDGLFYYAMEYLDGVNLENLVRLDGPQPAPRVIHILIQVCGALDEAHAMGMIHRDIKPANVILCQRGRQPDVAKVVDFGLVKEVERGAADSAISHRSDEPSGRDERPIIVGTAAYISPEAVADPQRVGPHSDLYSVGALGYYLLTGKRLFEGRTALEVCVQHVTAPPTPPSRRTDNPIPAELEGLILACLAKDPAARPTSAEALRLALSRLPAHLEWDETAAREWWRDFALRHAQDRAVSADPAEPVTMTVDVSERTESSPPERSQVTSTGQVR